MLEAFLDFIRQQNLIPAGSRVILAVSGGPDSVVMTDLFSKTGIKVAVAHVNFNLRGEESNEDENFVRSLAKEYGIECYVKNTDTHNYAGKNKLSVQEAARNIRYDWFDQLIIDLNFDLIATAHHFDDQIETFFINVLRGSGLTGLKGIPVKRGKIIRPLLFASREQIEEYANKHNLKFREDSSNLSGKYLRNRIRHSLIPVLQKVDENYRVGLQKTLGILNEDHEIFRQLLNEKKKLITEKNGIVSLPKSMIVSLFPGDVWLYYLLKDFGFNRDVSNTVYEAIKNNETGKLFYSDNYELLNDRDLLLLKKSGARAKDGTFYIRFAGDVLTTPFKLISEIAHDVRSLKIKDDPTYAYFDLEKLTFPLIVRKWRKGDRFVPFGMKGSRLVSDFLVDRKIDRFVKENIYVLESGKKIIWIIGYRVSEGFRITGKTAKVLILKLLNDRD